MEKEKVEKVLELSDDTLTALKELAVITGTVRGVGQFMQEAAQIVEWCIYQQLNGYNIVTLTDKELNRLELPPDREALASLIEQGLEEKAKKYFQKAA